MEEIVVILQKESEKFILKFFQTGTPSQPPLSPIIKMNTLLVRENAVCECPFAFKHSLETDWASFLTGKNALFLVNMSTNNSQMYDLCAEDEVKRETYVVFTVYPGWLLRLISWISVGWSTFRKRQRLTVDARANRAESQLLRWFYPSWSRIRTRKRHESRPLTRPPRSVSNRRRTNRPQNRKRLRRTKITGSTLKIRGRVATKLPVSVWLRFVHKKSLEP